MMLTPNLFHLLLQVSCLNGINVARGHQLPAWKGERHRSEHMAAPNVRRGSGNLADMKPEHDAYSTIQGGGNGVFVKKVESSDDPVTPSHRLTQQQLLLADWEVCDSSEECTNGCCTSVYSDDGQLKCTPVDSSSVRPHICIVVTDNADGGSTLTPINLVTSEAPSTLSTEFPSEDASFYLSSTMSPGSPSEGNCGGGNRGNGICPDGTCCSSYGWCGMTSTHCGSTPPPTPLMFCGNGVRGNGICPDSTCCSPNGWCGTTPEHCSFAIDSAAELGPTFAPTTTPSSPSTMPPTKPRVRRHALGFVCGLLATVALLIIICILIRGKKQISPRYYSGRFPQRRQTNSDMSSPPLELGDKQNSFCPEKRTLSISEASMYTTPYPGTSFYGEQQPKTVLSFISTESSVDGYSLDEQVPDSLVDVTISLREEP